MIANNSIFYIIGSIIVLAIAFFVIRECHDKPLREAFEVRFNDVCVYESCLHVKHADIRILSVLNTLVMEMTGYRGQFELIGKDDVLTMFYENNLFEAMFSYDNILLEA